MSTPLASSYSCRQCRKNVSQRPMIAENTVAERNYKQAVLQ